MTMSWGTLFTFLGYTTGAAVLVFTARRRKMATEGMGYVALAGLVGGVLGAKLMVWTGLHWGSLAASPFSVVDPRSGGRSILGGVLGGWLAVEWMKRRLGIRRSTGDLFALALPAGEAVGRIGCLINGCCYGIVSTAPWAIHQHGALRHPTQIYSALAALGIFFILLAVKNRMRREGDLFRLYLVLWGSARFLIEFLRENDALYFGLSLFQWIALEMALMFGLALWLSGRKPLAIAKPKKEEAWTS